MKNTFLNKAEFIVLMLGFTISMVNFFNRKTVKIENQPRHKEKKKQ